MNKEAMNLKEGRRYMGELGGNNIIIISKKYLGSPITPDGGSSDLGAVIELRAWRACA